MKEDIYTYQVKCSTCFTKFKVELFDSHEKNLFVADKKEWYCDTCKKEFFDKQSLKYIESQKKLGFSELTGTQKMVSWALKIRAEMLNKVDFYKNSLSFDSDQEKELSDKSFQLLLKEWQEKANAKWWIDNKRMNIRNISNRIEELSKNL